MSKARRVSTVVLIEGRSQSQVARNYGVSASWISRLIARYTLDGDAAFEPRSRRPHTRPTRLPQATIDLSQLNFPVAVGDHPDGDMAPRCKTRDCGNKLVAPEAVRAGSCQPCRDKVFAGYEA